MEDGTKGEWHVWKRHGHFSMSACFEGYGVVP